MSDDGLTIIEAAAMAAHEMNRIYCQMLDDFSQPRWEDAPDWQRESARDGVRNIIDNDGEITPEQSHENWMTMKLAEGWTWGEIKDPEAKTHPCLVPYGELPEDQRAKDRLFIATVRSFLQLT